MQDTHTGTPSGTPSGRTARPEPDRPHRPHRPGLLLPLAALLLALSSLVLGVVFTTAVSADADSRMLFSLTNTLATLMEMVVIGLGIASLVVTATALRARRTPWEPAVADLCTAIALIILSLPVTILPFGYDQMEPIFTVVATLGAVAAFVGLVFFLVAAARRRYASTGQLVSSLLVILTALITGAFSTGLLDPVTQALLPWFGLSASAVLTVLALVAVVLRWMDRRNAPPASSPLDPAPASAQAPADTALRTLAGLRLLGTPAALLLIMLAVIQGTEGFVLLGVACLLALAALVAAVLEARRRTHPRRTLDAVGAVLVPLAVLLTPAAILVFSINDDSGGWGALLGLGIGGIASILLGLIGLVFTAVTAFSSRSALHRTWAGRASAVATAATLVPAGLVLPLIADGGQILLPVALATALAGLVFGCIEVARHSAAPARPLSDGSVVNPYAAPHDPGHGSHR